MITTRKVRLEPNNKQNTKMFQSAGTSRWGYNWTISEIENLHHKDKKSINPMDLSKKITKLKQEEDFKWLNNYSNNIIKQSIRDACNAYLRFLNKKSNKPKFKKAKRTTPSFYQDTSNVKFKNGKVRLQKIGWVRLSEKGTIPNNVKYMNPRIKFDGCNWYITISFEVDVCGISLTDKSIGIDVGVSYLATVSNIDHKFKNINKSEKIKKIEKRKKRLQHKVSKKYSKNNSIKTKNIIKIEKKIIKTYKKINNIRTNYMHDVADEIIKTNPSKIIMETLNISGMLKNKRLSKEISDQGFYKFKKIIKYKSEKFGISFIEANRWYKSSKICSECGNVKTKLTLSERKFICEKCGFEIDRDKNASINLSKYTIE